MVHLYFIYTKNVDILKKEFSTKVRFMKPKLKVAVQEDIDKSFYLMYLTNNPSFLQRNIAPLAVKLVISFFVYNA